MKGNGSNSGAFAGHFFCHREIDSVDGDDKGLACH